MLTLTSRLCGIFVGTGGDCDLGLRGWMDGGGGREHGPIYTSLETIYILLG